MAANAGQAYRSRDRGCRAALPAQKVTRRLRCLRAGPLGWGSTAGETRDAHVQSSRCEVMSIVGGLTFSAHPRSTAMTMAIREASPRGGPMQRSYPQIEITAVNSSGLLRAKCLSCGGVLAWSKDPKLLAIAARAHLCRCNQLSIRQHYSAGCTYKGGPERSSAA